MGFVEPMTIISTVPSIVVPIGASLALWVSLVSLLAVSALGIAVSGSRPQRQQYPVLRPLRTAEAS